MAQDSIAYGESLLADIRDRNDKLRSQAKKEAKKEKWKSMAVNIGMDLANDIFKSKQIAFQNSEANVQNKLQIETGNNYANGVIAEHQKADVYKGGVNAYVMDNVKNELKFEYGKTYAEGNRNELEFNELINSEAAKLFDTRLKEYNERLTKTKEYLAGGDLARYNSNIKELSGKGTAQGALSGLITKLTGNSNADLYNSQNEEILRQSKEYQDTYSSTWKQTRSSTLAKAVAENMPSDLGMPSPTIGTAYTVESTDLLGNVSKTRVTPVLFTVKNKEGKPVQITRAMQLGANGYVPYTPSQQAQDIDMAMIAGSLNDKQVAAGKIKANDMSTEAKQKINKIFEAQILAAHDLKKGEPGYAAMRLQKDEVLARKIMTAGITAQKEEWGTQKTGEKVFIKALENKLKEKGVGSVTDIGRLNIFDTMFAMQELTTTSDLRIGKSGMQHLANRPKDIYTALEGMGAQERNTLFNRLADSVDGGVNYFQGNINSEDFKADILGFKNIFKNQEKYNLDKGNFDSVDAMLFESIKELKNRTTEEKNAAGSLERREALLEKLKKMSLIPTL